VTSDREVRYEQARKATWKEVDVGGAHRV